MRRIGKIAPVAEYRGRALVEVAGKHRAVWRGIEYVDQVANGEVSTRVGPLTLDTFLTCRRVCGILRIPYCSKRIARHWDEEQGVFI